MEKSYKDTSEYKMKKQAIRIGIICLVFMASLTVFLMRRYRQQTETIFANLIEEPLLSSHSKAFTQMEDFLAGEGNSEGIEDAWEEIDKDEKDIFHYICNSEGEILAGEMKIFDIRYTVASELRDIRVKDKKIEEVEEELKKLKEGEPYVFSNLHDTGIYLVASKFAGHDWILMSGYRSEQMETYKTMIIKSNRALIFILLTCAGLLILLTLGFYMKQQKKAMKGQARYNILSEFSDTVLFEYDCMDKVLVFTPNITTLFKLKEVGPIHPFDKNIDFTMIHPDDIEKMRKLLSTIGDETDEIDNFVIRFKDIDGNYRWVRWKGRLVRGRLGGDEFIVFMSHTNDPRIAENKGNEILEKLKTSTLEPKFTISIGAAAYPTAGDSYENLYLAADHAMYVSKKTGKNRIHVETGTAAETE